MCGAHVRNDHVRSEALNSEGDDFDDVIRDAGGLKVSHDKYSELMSRGIVIFFSGG